MTTITSLFLRLVLALTLATGAGAAMAVPASYHISVDTGSLSGTGYLDLAFTGLDGTTASAIVTNFTGNASGASILTGNASGDLATTATLMGGTNYTWIDQLVQFGGVFGLDVMFDFANTGAGNTFTMQFFNQDFSAYLGVQGPFATIELIPGTGTSFTTAGGIATVTETITAAVPEPGQWLLMLTGLLLLAATARRRNM